jgi:hypothetical protein
MLLLSAAKQSRSRDVYLCTSQRKSWFWVLRSSLSARTLGDGSREMVACSPPPLCSLRHSVQILGRHSLSCDTLHPPNARAASPSYLAWGAHSCYLSGHNTHAHTHGGQAVSFRLPSLSTARRAVELTRALSRLAADRYLQDRQPEW